MYISDRVWFTGVRCDSVGAMASVSPDKAAHFAEIRGRGVYGVLCIGSTEQQDITKADEYRLLSVLLFPF